MFNSSPYSSTISLEVKDNYKNFPLELLICEPLLKQESLLYIKKKSLQKTVGLDFKVALLETITYPLPVGTFEDDFPFPVWWDMLVSLEGLVRCVGYQQSRPVFFLLGPGTAKELSQLDSTQNQDLQMGNKIGPWIGGTNFLGRHFYWKRKGDSFINGGLYATYHLLGEPETTIDFMALNFWIFGWFLFHSNVDWWNNGRNYASIILHTYIVDTCFCLAPLSAGSKHLWWMICLFAQEWTI